MVLGAEDVAGGQRPNEHAGLDCDVQQALKVQLREWPRNLLHGEPRARVLEGIEGQRLVALRLSMSQ